MAHGIWQAHHASHIHRLLNETSSLQPSTPRRLCLPAAGHQCSGVCCNWSVVPVLLYGQSAQPTS
jgi:hypothetical protein